MTQAVKIVTSTIKSHMVCSEDGKNTYVIRKAFPERTGNKAMVVQLYPTLTDKDIDTTDSTMQHLLSHLDDLELKEVVFVNLFSKVCKVRPSTKDLAVDEANLEQIKKLMMQKDFADWKVIISWGSSMNKNIIATEMRRRIIQMYKEYVPNGVLWQLTADDIYMKNESAVHALYMGIRHKRSRWKLEKYQIPADLAGEGTAKRGKGKQKKVEPEKVVPEGANVTKFPQKEASAEPEKHDVKQEGDNNA